jgi:ABC-type branched-subunit amino acid transport system substrate-binding protein
MRALFYLNLHIEQKGFGFRGNMKAFAIIILIFLSLTALDTAAAQAGAPAGEKIQIGVSIPLTGGAVTFGFDGRDILTFANEKLANSRYQLVFVDDKCSAKDGVEAANKLINIYKVKYVIGLLCSATTIAAAPLYERAKVLAMVTWASAPKIAKSGDYIFRTTPSDKLAVQKLWEHIKSKHKQLTILSGQNDYAQDFKDTFLELNKKYNALSITNEDYLPHSPDFKSILVRLRTANPESLFLNTEDESAFGVLLKNLAEIRWKIPLYGAYWPSAEVLLTTEKQYMEGVEFVDTPSLKDLLNNDGKELYKEYLKEFGPLRGSESSFASVFEGFRALDAAIQSGKDAREYLYNTKFKGIFGDYSFDSDGESSGIPFVIKRVEDGQTRMIG